jgi:putative nucleotidyltransferase with HDIG domain
MRWFDRFRGAAEPSSKASSEPATTPTSQGGKALPVAEPGASPATMKFLSRVAELQAVPALASRLLQTLDDPLASADAIARDVRMDQGLMSTLLRLANSAFYNASGQVRDITEAIVVLGYDTTRQLVLGRLSRQVLRKNDDWQKTLWRHALATALGAQACAREVRGLTVAYAFTGGLLHDIGKAVMHEAFAEQCEEVWKKMGPTDRSEEAEHSQFETDHTQVGAELLRMWQFPAMYQHVARYHAGGPGAASAKDRRLVSIVALGGAVASWLGYDAVPEREGPDPNEHPAINELCGSSYLVEQIQRHIETELAPLVDIFG